MSSYHSNTKTSSERPANNNNQQSTPLHLKPEPVFRLRDMFKPSFDLWVISWILGLVTAISMIGLLMISGWFITGAALAGLIAVGSHTFNYMLPAGIIRMLAMARTAGRYGELMVSHNAVFDLLRTLRLRFFNRLAALPLTQQRQTMHASQYMHRLVSDIDKLNEFILRVVSPWLIGTVAVVLLALFISWTLPIRSAVKLVIFGMLFLALALPFTMSLRGIKQAKQLSHVSEARRQKLLAPLAIITQLLLWQQWHEQTKGYIAEDNHLQQLEWQAQKQRSAVMLGIQWLFYSCVLLVLYGIAQLTDSIQIPDTLTMVSVPLVLAAVLGLLGIQEIIVPLGQHYLALGNSIAAKNRLNALLDSNNPLGDSADNSFNGSFDIKVSRTENNLNLHPPKYASSHSNGLALPVGDITVKLHRVSAKMPKALVGAKDVEAVIHTGIPFIIKGPSGCGKSTLLQVLAGEIALVSGQVTVHEESLTDEHLNEANLNDASWFDYNWQDQLGYLGQQLDIFDQSLAANLRLGKPDASDDELRDVLYKVGLNDWLALQPQGLATPLGEYGSAISGGQARRIALARLLLKPRRVLLLDEPFAGLDRQTREHVWHHIREHQKSDILIVVSHHEWDMGACETLTLQANIFS